MSQLFENLKKTAEHYNSTLRNIHAEEMPHKVCQGCKLPYPARPGEAEELLKPFPVCDACLEALKPIYEKRGELK